MVRKIWFAKRRFKFYLCTEKENRLNQDNNILTMFHSEKTDLAWYGSTGI